MVLLGAVEEAGVRLSHVFACPLSWTITCGSSDGWDERRGKCKAGQVARSESRAAAWLVSCRLCHPWFPTASVLRGGQTHVLRRQVQLNSSWPSELLIEVGR